MDERTLHNLKTPLTVITCQTQMMQRRIQRGADPDKDQLLKALDVIEQMVAGVNAAIDALASDTQEDTPPPAKLPGLEKPSDFPRAVAQTDSDTPAITRTTQAMVDSSAPFAMAV